jgi:HxlR-like helix-turn-helix
MRCTGRCDREILAAVVRRVRGRQRFGPVRPAHRPDGWRADHAFSQRGPPVTVTYELTERGQALMPALDLIAAWARDNLPPGDC